jgi:hypothetical protein
MSHDPSVQVLEMQLKRLTSGALSSRSRYGHVALLLASTMMCVLIGSLLATEAGLPHRTQAAFSVLLAIGIGWTGYALWVLARRSTLLANHRVVAGWMAVCSTTLFLAGTLALACLVGGAGFRAAAGLGVLMLAAAIVLLLRAIRRMRLLQAQRRELERQLDMPI